MNTSIKAALTALAITAAMAAPVAANVGTQAINAEVCRYFVWLG